MYWRVDSICLVGGIMDECSSCFQGCTAVLLLLGMYRIAIFKIRPEPDIKWTIRPEPEPHI